MLEENTGHREVKSTIQGHTANEWQSQDLKPSCLAPESILLTSRLSNTPTRLASEATRLLGLEAFICNWFLGLGSQVYIEQPTKKLEMEKLLDNSNLNGILQNN